MPLRSNSIPPRFALKPSLCYLYFCAVVPAMRKCACANEGFTGRFFRVGRAGVAQLVEHLICNQRVGGSNPFASSTLENGHGAESGKDVGPTQAVWRRVCPPR